MKACPELNMRVKVFVHRLRVHQSKNTYLVYFINFMGDYINRMDELSVMYLIAQCLAT